MKANWRTLLILLLFTGISSFVILGQTPNRPKLDVASLREVPEGNYLVTLELDGQKKRLNFKVEGNRARCVNSSDPSLRSIQGRFESKGNGMFIGYFQGGNFRASQLWIFRNDGIAAIREAPDRGEIQSAIPVKGDSIEPPKEKD